jgi:hypothetical protein
MSQNFLGEPEFRLILSMEEAKQFQKAYMTNNVVLKTKNYRRIMDNHSEFFLHLIETAYRIGDIDASLCSGWIPKTEPATIRQFVENSKPSTEETFCAFCHVKIPPDKAVGDPAFCSLQCANKFYQEHGDSTQ